MISVSNVQKYPVQKYKVKPFPFFTSIEYFWKVYWKIGQSLKKQNKIEKKIREKENPSYIEFI